MKLGGIKIDKPGIANTNVWGNKPDSNARPGTSGTEKYGNFIRTMAATGIGSSLTLSKPPGIGLKIPMKGGNTGVATGFDPSQKKQLVIGNTVLKKQENKLKDSDDSDDGDNRAFSQQVVDPVGKNLIRTRLKLNKK